uniref:Large ribosomal subunit protein bL28m n=1 Tax=Evadne anonyx TaxID=141404 RepID=A0A9N6WSB2_9CRUS|nr:EOG090X0GHI [Evadne anonyx]
MPLKFRSTVLDTLPVCYQQFFKQWKYAQPTAVHYQPEEGTWKRIPETGQVVPIQNKPLPLSYPAEFDQGLWGGEAVVKGFIKRHPLRRRVAHFWFPTLQKAVFHSEILDQHFEIVVTPRTLRLVDQHFGFDNYILETPPQDLKSLLGLKIKRTLLLALARKDFLPDNPSKRDWVYDKYKKHIIPEEEAEWYGLSLKEAIDKMKQAQTSESSETSNPGKHGRKLQLKQNLKAKECRPALNLNQGSVRNQSMRLNLQRRYPLGYAAPRFSGFLLRNSFFGT